MALCAVAILGQASVARGATVPGYDVRICSANRVADTASRAAYTDAGWHERRER